MSGDPLDTAPEDVGGLEVVATFVAGRRVHGDPP
ncbi:putative amidohydrolase YtcJ [Actinomadura namibiensis]|uniref:Putative amidohydrolase YtcJ n=1 Tax=Actinomadura namibiensis TaxID=182080 RepID=A0A7W3LZN3_ACTNM|nr:putative amidohydrolase YtcJ [Actinomadura namibiensis]